MARVPDEFSTEFEEKGETFYEIAELLYTHPDRQYTQDELADVVGRSNMTISKHTRAMVEEEWLTRQEDQTTFAWNTEAHNPASTEGLEAAKRFYVDLWDLLRKHSQTTPGAYAIMGFTLILTAIVVFVFFVGFSLGIGQGSNIPTVSYLVIALGAFLCGMIVTFLSPLQAVMNRFIWRIFS